MNPLEKAWREAFRPIERMTLPEFAKKYVKIGAKKADFDLELFRWLQEPMELMTDYRVPMQAQIIFAQGGKGRSAEASLPYFVVYDPVDFTWFDMTNDTATEYAEQRLMPLLLSCEPVQQFRPANRHKERTCAIHMAHMIAEVLGANKTNTQSRTRQVIICNEAWTWEPGMLASAISRTSAPNLVGRRKVIITSTAGDEDSDLERYWDTCDQRAWHARCPRCKEAHPFALSRDHCRRVPSHVKVFSLKWDENEVTRPGGATWNMEEVKKTVRQLCPSCGHEFYETPEVMRWLRESGHYVAMNKHASREKVGFWVPRMAAGEWAALVERFLKANDERKMGDDSNLREFMLKDLAEKWAIGGADIPETRKVGDYDLFDPPESFVWEKEHARFMTVDRQALAPFFWYVVRAWSVNGESRLVECGFCNAKSDVEQIAERHGLTGIKAMQVGVDAGFESDDTWSWCAANHWYAFRGDDAISYRHTKPGHKTVLKYFSPKIKRQVGMGTKEQGVAFCFEFLWSNLSIKSFLTRLKSGNGLSYEVPRNVPDWWAQHMDSEFKKREIKGGKTTYRFVRRGKRPNHIFDCEGMSVACAMMAGLIPIGVIAAKEEDSEKLEIEQVS